MFSPSLRPSLIRRFSSAPASSAPYDVVVIGAGPGGYVAAIKAAQLGLRTACIESRGTLGGTCLNVGCIPSKALLNSSHHFHDSQHNFSKWGIDVSAGGVKMNLPNLMNYKSKVVTGLTKGIEGLFKKNQIEWIKGEGKFVSSNSIAVGGKTFSAKNFIIATGSAPAALPNVEVDEKQIVTSTGALSFPEVPQHLIVIGAGVIGLELGSVWARLGAKVTVIEYGERVTPGIDTEISAAFRKSLEKQKFSFVFNAAVTGAKKNPSGKVTVTYKKDGADQQMEADAVLVATGRRPFTAGLGAESLGLKMTKGMIDTDSHFRTNIPNIYAIGDVIAGPMLAHKAEEEGIAAAEIIAGKAGHVNYSAIPGVVYTWPEVATVGMSEDDAKKAKVPFRVTKFPFIANSRAKTNDEYEGLVKVISDSETDRLLGFHIIGPNAGELIAEATLALEYGASAEDIARTCHAHPTLSEAVKEACMQKPIHF